MQKFLHLLITIQTESAVMKKSLYLHLSKRESQIMDVIHHLGEASVTDILENMDEPPSYNSVRVTLTILEKKGYLLHRVEDQRYIYTPTDLPDDAKRTALEHIVSTFFDGSASGVVSTLLSMNAKKISEKELDELSEMIDKARKEKRR